MNLSEFSRKGGKAGSGEAKRRSTSFTSATAKAALKARWAKMKRSKTKARGLRQNAAGER